MDAVECSRWKIECDPQDTCSGFCCFTCSDWRRHTDSQNPMRQIDVYTPSDVDLSNPAIWRPGRTPPMPTTTVLMLTRSHGSPYALRGVRSSSHSFPPRRDGRAGNRGRAQ
jgi:hypothetical protein